jgi:5'-nucleotidase
MIPVNRYGQNRSTWKRILVILPTILLLLGSGIATVKADSGKPHFWLTVLHNNDGESQLIDAGRGQEDFGGAARFATLVQNLKFEATRGPRNPNLPPGGKRGVIMLSSGDNFLAGPEFNASLEKGVAFYDTIAMDLIGYDAAAIGNHEFDFGPDVLADFIGGFVWSVPFVSANLDFSGEPNLQQLVDDGTIAKSVVVVERDEWIGIVGATTPALPFISSPRNVIVDPDVAGAIQAEIDVLQMMGVDKIIVISHQQDIEADLALATLLTGVDIMVAGGGDELLANPGDLLVPGDEGDIYGDYPLWALGGDGVEVPVVTTNGNYKYVGRLVVGFDKEGRVVKLDEDNSGPVRVAGDDCGETLPCDDAVPPDPDVEAQVVAPVAEYVADLASNVIGFSEVDLDGTRINVRSRETNQGNLIADSLRWQADQLAASFGVPSPDVALQNGGGIRNDSIIPSGDITELDTFDMVPFSNFVTVLPDIPRSQFKEILENAVSRTQPGDTPGGTGRFAQISGFSYVWSGSGTAQVLNSDGTVDVPGTRVLDVVLDDGTPIVSGGVVLAGPDLTVGTIDFLARGGDQYPYRGAPFTTLGVTYQQALANYIIEELGGLISGADYPEGGEGRNTELP